MRTLNNIEWGGRGEMTRMFEAVIYSGRQNSEASLTSFKYHYEVLPPFLDAIDRLSWDTGRGAGFLNKFGALSCIRKDNQTPSQWIKAMN